MCTRAHWHLHWPQAVLKRIDTGIQKCTAMQGGGPQWTSEIWCVTWCGVLARAGSCWLLVARVSHTITRVPVPLAWCVRVEEGGLVHWPPLTVCCCRMTSAIARYGKHDTTGGNVGDSSSAMGRIAWFDGKVRAREGGGGGAKSLPWPTAAGVTNNHMHHHPSLGFLCAHTPPPRLPLPFQRAQHCFILAVPFLALTPSATAVSLPGAYPFCNCRRPSACRVRPGRA